MYKVILFNHGETAANGRVLLDTSSGENPGLTQAVVETKLNEPGSFNYSIVPAHPLYGMTDPLKVYVSVEEDGTEIFYGRILSVQTNPLTKIKSVTCEGALAFLLDVELPKDSEEWTSTAANYFTYCISKYNEGIQNDANRLFTIGAIDAAGASESHSYNNGSFTQIQNVMKSQLLNAHDGFFRIRRYGSAGKHYIDWVKQVGQTNPQAIAITQNVISQTNTESGEDIFSIMRPVGNDDLTLDGTGLIVVSQSMVDDYGPIIRTVTFDAGDVDTLRAKAIAYIEKIKNRLTIAGDISFVDFHFLDGSSTKVHVGDVFTNIAGYEGTKLTAESVSRNLLDAGKDKMSIKSDKELMSSAAASGANSSNTTGVKAGRKASSGSAHMYKFYHETQTDASLAAKNLFISAEEKIETRAKTVETYADQIDEKLSEAVGKVKVNTDNLQKEWTTYKGTEIYKNKDHIDQVCGLYQVEEYTDPKTGKTEKRLVVQEGSALYQTHNGVIMGVYDNYNLTGGMMVDKINGQTETLITGNHVIIKGTTTIQDAMTIEDGNLRVKKAVSIGTESKKLVTINDGKINADTVQVNSGGSLLLVGSASGEHYSINVDGGSGYISIKNFIKSASLSKDGKTLTLTPVYGDAINFRRATSLIGKWSGSELTISGTPAQTPALEWKVQFEGNYNSKRTNLNVVANGDLSVSTLSGVKYINAPIRVEKLTGEHSQPDTVYAKDLTFNSRTVLQSLGTVTANGPKTPDENYVGFSSFTVDVPSKITYDPEYDDGEGHTYKVVKASRTGQDYMRIYVQNTAPTANNNWIRTINVTVGGNEVETLELPDYKNGYDAVSAPSVNFTAINGNAGTTHPSGKATIPNTFGGSARSTNISLTSNSSVYQDGGGKWHKCVDIVHSGSIVGRLNVDSVWNNGGLTGWLESTETGNPNDLLEYDTMYKVVYTQATGARANVPNAVWKTKPDRWQEGYNYAVQTITPESHSGPYSMVCTKKTPAGNGYSDFVFEGTFKSTDFNKGKVDFYK